jgi:large conductance mechanosensitive channel
MLKDEKKLKEYSGQGFLNFLKKYSIIGLALAVVIGGAVSKLTDAIATGILTPLISLLLPKDSFKNFVFMINGSVFQIGLVIDALLNFIIIAFVIYLVVKLVIKEEREEKKELK